MKKLKITSLYNNFHFLIIPPLLIGAAFYYPVVLVILFIYYLYILKKHLFIKQIIIISILFTAIFFSFNNYKSTKDNGFSGIVCEKSDTKYKVLSGFEYVIIYSNDSLIPGDKIKVEGQSATIKEESYENGFNYKKYLRSKKTYNVYYNPKIDKIKHYNDLSYLRYKIINFYQSRLDDSTSTYLNTLIFGYNNLDTATKDGIKNIGISHLFAISGFHIMIMYKIISFILSKFIKNEYITTPIITLFFLFYILFTSFNISILRSSIMLIIMLYSKIYNKLYTSLDRLSISLFIVLIINPGYLYQTSFILTYLITFVLIITSSITFSKHKIISSLKLNTIAFLASLPIVININGSVNILSIILVSVFTFIVGYILIPYMLILLFIPSLYSIGIIKVFNKMISILSNYHLKIRMPYLNIYFIIIYYILFMLILIMIEEKKKNYKLIFISIFFFLLIANINVLKRYYEITMIDVGQGDSMLISLPYNKGSMLIDSYGYNLGYLKNKGVKRLDYLVLTHTDSDHTEGYEDIIKEYRVKKVITNAYDDIQGITDYVKAGDSFYFGDILINVLSPNLDYKDINNNSLVLQFKVCDYTILLTGDIEKEAEEDLVSIYGSKLRSDILKVAHHGSATSSTSNFIKYVNPRYSLISVGLNNKYKFPSSTVLKTLSKSSIYQTDLCGNITIKISNSKFSINPYKKI